jgi:hypothetical protein
MDVTVTEYTKDGKAGRIVRGKDGKFLPGTSTHAPVTHDNAQQFQQARIAAKREVMAAAANAAIDGGKWSAAGNLAYAAAIADTAMLKATTPDDPKAIEAARFLLENTGLAEQRTQQQQDSVPAAIAGELVTMLRDVLAQRGVVVDAEVIE